MKPPSLKRLLGVLFFVAMGSVFLFLLAEGYARVSSLHSLRFPQPLFIEDKLLAFTYNGANPFSPGGFRSGPVSKHKRKGVIRIICLGESVTSGDLLDASQTWPSRLASYLNEKSPHDAIEIINAAVGGYGTKHILLQVEHRLAAYSPDIILIYAGLNGRGELSDSVAWTPQHVTAPQDNFIMRLDKFLIRYSYLYINRIHWRVEPFVLAHSVNPLGEESVAECNDNMGVKKDLSAMAESARAGNMVPVFIVYPMCKQEFDPRDQGYRTMMLERIRILREIPFRTKARAIDMTEVFTSIGPEDQRYFFDVKHMNAAGCDRFASVLADSLKDIVAAFGR
jgi:lysophospholipase L1-like esterase